MSYQLRTRVAGKCIRQQRKMHKTTIKNDNKFSNFTTSRHIKRTIIITTRPKINTTSVSRYVYNEARSNWIPSQVS